jgi:hypothetical protein
MSPKKFKSLRLTKLSKRSCELMSTSCEAYELYPFATTYLQFYLHQIHMN